MNNDKIINQLHHIFRSYHQVDFDELKEFEIIGTCPSKQIEELSAYNIDALSHVENASNIEINNFIDKQLFENFLSYPENDVLKVKSDNFLDNFKNIIKLIEDDQDHINILLFSNNYRMDLERHYGKNFGELLHNSDFKFLEEVDGLHLYESNKLVNKYCFIRFNKDKKFIYYTISDMVKDGENDYKKTVSYKVFKPEIKNLQLF